MVNSFCSDFMFACQIFLAQISTIQEHSNLSSCDCCVFSQIQHTDDMENEIDELLQEFEDKSHRPFLHTVCFY